MGTNNVIALHLISTADFSAIEIRCSAIVYNKYSAKALYKN